MAEESRRTRRSDRYAAVPERVNHAADQMRAEGLRFPAGGGVPSPDPRGSTPPPGNVNMPPQGGMQPPHGAYYPGWPQQNMPPVNGAGGRYTGPQSSPGYQGGYPDPYTAQAYEAQRIAAQQGAAWRQEQERIARQTSERKRVSSETASRGALRGYTVESQRVPEGGESSPGKKPRRNLALILSLTLVALAIAAGGITAGINAYQQQQILDAVTPYDQLYCEGVYVDGIHLGGMTREQAENSVQSQIQQRNSVWYVHLTYQGDVIAKIDAAMLSMTVDAKRVLEEAWKQGHTGTPEERLEAMKDLRVNPYAGYTATPTGDTSVIDGLLEGLKTRFEKPARDAALTAFDPSLPYPFTFMEEEEGSRLDTGTVRDELYHMVSTMMTGSVELKPDVIEPNVRLADLQKHYMLRSSVYTQISTISPEERNHNIQRAMEIVNGYVLDSGKKFSFNSVVGERSTANGFLPAVEYVYNEHVMGVGGGVCQASTTIYQAAVCAGMEILDRTPHSDSVSYTEYGKDATVYWYGKRKIDLVFRNTSEDPIYMVAGVQPDPSNKKRLICKVTMYGADMGDVRYELEAVVAEELEPPEEPEYIKDKNAEYVTYTDQQKSVAKAQPGYVVDSYRVEYRGGEFVERIPLATDTYKPKAERIYVGVTKRE